MSYFTEFYAKSKEEASKIVNSIEEMPLEVKNTINRAIHAIADGAGDLIHVVASGHIASDEYTYDNNSQGSLQVTPIIVTPAPEPVAPPAPAPSYPGGDSNDPVPPLPGGG